MPVLQPIIGYIAKRPWIVAIAALLVIAGVLKFRLQSAQLSLAREKASNASMSAALKEQNQAVAEWMNAAVAQTRRAETAEKEAARMRVLTAARVERVLTEPVPADCPGAVSWGAEFGSQVGKEWEEAVR